MTNRHSHTKKENENFCYIVEYTCSKFILMKATHSVWNRQVPNTETLFIFSACFVLCQRELQ